MRKKLSETTIPCQIFHAIMLDSTFISKASFVQVTHVNVNPFNAEAAKPCHVGIHRKALTEYFQMSTHLPRF